MLTDQFGCAVTLSSRAALSDWQALQLAFLAHGGSTADHLAATLRAEPDFALGHAAKGLFLLMLGRRELVPTAREALAAARAGGAETARELAYVAALADWLDGHPERAARRIETALDDAPRDALAMKISHGIRFILGHRRDMLAVLDRLVPAYDTSHPAYGYFLGCRAFALEENGAYDRARAAGLRALEHAADDAWGLHAVAHVHDMRGDSAGGIAWLTGREAAWEHCNNFRYHVWWHKALMHLDRGETDIVLALYDEKVRADHTDDYRDIANATSLLMRLELEGVAVGDRWEELADLSERRTDDGCLIFADLHYLLALIGGGREAAAHRLVQRIARDGARARTDFDRRFDMPGTAAAEGLEAFGEGSYARAAERLAAARRDMYLAGGSHAQRDVFERLTIDAALRAGRFTAASAMLDDRASLRDGAEDGFCASRRALIDRMSRSVATAG